MSKEIKLVYQDCAFCHGRESYGEKQMEIARREGFSIKRLAFNDFGAPGLIKQAVSRGIDRLPFFTDGQRFSYDLNDFVKDLLDQTKPEVAEAMMAKTKARVKSRIKRKTEHGSDTSD